MMFRFGRSRLHAGAVLVLSLLVLGWAVPAEAQRTSRAPASAPRAATTAPQTAATAPETATAPGTPGAVPGAPATTGPATAGVCQCISDHTARRLNCLGSAAECQSICGTTHFSFVPYAWLTCPAGEAAASASPTAPEATSAPMSPGR